MHSTGTSLPTAPSVLPISSIGGTPPSLGAWAHEGSGGSAASEACPRAAATGSSAARTSPVSITFHVPGGEPAEAPTFTEGWRTMARQLSTVTCSASSAPPTSVRPTPDTLSSVKPKDLFREVFCKVTAHRTASQSPPRQRAPGALAAAERQLSAQFESLGRQRSASEKDERTVRLVTPAQPSKTSQAQQGPPPASATHNVTFQAASRPPQLVLPALTSAAPSQSHTSQPVAPAVGPFQSGGTFWQPAGDAAPQPAPPPPSTWMGFGVQPLPMPLPLPAAEVACDAWSDEPDAAGALPTPKLWAAVAVPVVPAVPAVWVCDASTTGMTAASVAAAADEGLQRGRSGGQQEDGSGALMAAQQVALAVVAKAAIEDPTASHSAMEEAVATTAEPTAEAENHHSSGAADTSSVLTARMLQAVGDGGAERSAQVDAQQLCPADEPNNQQQLADAQVAAVVAQPQQTMPLSDNELCLAPLLAAASATDAALADLLAAAAGDKGSCPEVAAALPPICSTVCQRQAAASQGNAQAAATAEGRTATALAGCLEAAPAALPGAVAAGATSDLPVPAVPGNAAPVIAAVPGAPAGRAKHPALPCVGGSVQEWLDSWSPSESERLSSSALCSSATPGSGVARMPESSPQLRVNPAFLDSVRRHSQGKPASPASREAPGIGLLATNPAFDSEADTPPTKLWPQRGLDATALAAVGAAPLPVPPPPPAAPQPGGLHQVLNNETGPQGPGAAVVEKAQGGPVGSEAAVGGQQACKPAAAPGVAARQLQATPQGQCAVGSGSEGGSSAGSRLSLDGRGACAGGGAAGGSIARRWRGSRFNASLISLAKQGGKRACATPAPAIDSQVPLPPTAARRNVTVRAGKPAAAKPQDGPAAELERSGDSKRHVLAAVNGPESAAAQKLPGCDSAGLSACGGGDGVAKQEGVGCGAAAHQLTDVAAQLRAAVGLARLVLVQQGNQLPCKENQGCDLAAKAALVAEVERAAAELQALLQSTQSDT